jgi:nucleotidyltransferase/DNA polymerase involved in DNA repair
MQWIVHVDMDAYYVSCEIRDRPELAGAPVIVGHDPEAGPSRGVVLSASYAARAKGVRSALPVSLAATRCPEAVWIAPDFEKYERTAHDIRVLLRRHAARVVPLSIDEAALEVERPDPGSVRSWAAEIQAEVLRSLRLPCSLGASPFATVAKIATDQAKPAGIRVVPPEETAAFLRPLKVTAVPGIGPKTAERLHEIAIDTVGELADAPLPVLTSVLGRSAVGWRLLARGTPEPGLAELGPDQGPVQRSMDRTLARDSRDPAVLYPLLEQMAEGLGRDLRESSLRFQSVVVRLRWSDFGQLQHGRKLPAPTEGEAVLRREALKLAATLLARERDGAQRAVRRISLGVGDLSPAPPGQRALESFLAA